MDSAPQDFDNHVEFASGSPTEIVEIAKEKGFENIYVDGGKTIQNFLRADLTDELIISEIPLLLGGGDRLFGSLDQSLDFELIGTEVLLNQIVQKRLQRKRG